MKLYARSSDILYAFSKARAPCWVVPQSRSPVGDKRSVMRLKTKCYSGGSRRPYSGSNFATDPMPQNVSAGQTQRGFDAAAKGLGNQDKGTGGRPRGHDRRTGNGGDSGDAGPFVGRKQAAVGSSGVQSPEHKAPIQCQAVVLWAKINTFRTLCSAKISGGTDTADAGSRMQ